MEKLRGLVDAGQIHRQVLEETSSPEEALTWLKEHGGLPKKSCACHSDNNCHCEDEKKAAGRQKLAMMIPAPEDYPGFYR